MIKQKKDLSQANNTCIDYLKSISVLSDQPNLLYARKRLDAAIKASQAIKENSPVEEEKKQTGETLAPSLEKELADSQTSTPNSTDSKASFSEKEKLKLFLDEMAANRNTNELIYGYKKGDDSQGNNKRWGIEASKIPGFYKKNFDSTITRGKKGWAEFGITYDNKFFLSPSSLDEQRYYFDFNHQTMGCGTFLKAAGRLKVENGKLIISPYSQYLVLGPDYLPIILFVLQKKGCPISPENTVITDEKGAFMPLINVNNPENYSVDPVNYYLNEALFPSAKAMAENEAFSIKARLSDLFLSIDDEILAVKNPQLIETLNVTRAALKVDLIGFLLLLAEAKCDVEKVLQKKDQDIKKINLEDGREGSSIQKQDVAEDKVADITQQTLFQRYEKIMDHIKAFQAEKIDMSFVTAELVTWFYYLSALSFKATGNKMEMMPYEERDNAALVLLQEIETSLKEIKASPTLFPQRYLDEFDRAERVFLKFYTENPLKTCVALLYDYTKGGFCGRFFSGAWRRHHVDAVEEFLKKYESQQFADDLSIQTIYHELFKIQGSLVEYFGKRGTLFMRLLFCAKLANEISGESVCQTVATISSKTNEELEVNGRSQQMVTSELLPITIPIDLVCEASSAPTSAEIGTPPVSLAEKSGCSF